MSQAAPPLSRHELEAQIVKRCWAHEAFRKEFIGDPAGSFAKYLNVPKVVIPPRKVSGPPSAAERESSLAQGPRTNQSTVQMATADKLNRRVGAPATLVLWQFRHRRQ